MLARAFAQAESWELGLGEAVPIAAEHGIGMSDLYPPLARPAVNTRLGLCSAHS